MRFRRALALCTAGAIAIGLGVAAEGHRADAASRRAAVTVATLPAPAFTASGAEAPATDLPAGGQALLLRLPNG